ncbi:glucoamylase family protein [Candidatus Auribacterota bacterium]
MLRICCSIILIAGLIMCARVVYSNDADEEYLRGLSRETWSYLDSHLAPQTGFPTDSQFPGGTTNTTNIGLYLACIGPAVEMGFISREDAVSRIGKILASLKKLESKHGFLPNWISVEGVTKIPAGVFAVSDFNKLITGLILVRQFFPEFGREAAELIDRVEWGWLYDRTTGKMHWGYDLANDTPVGPATFWLASDCRMVMFYTIASGSAPPELWDSANRNVVKADGLEFYAPGYEFGGIFMAAMGAMFLDEKGTEMGSSIADLAWHQIRESQRRGLKVWGWSNCNIPGAGYTEGGFIPWRVVTPHASALVIEYYPRHVIANLKALEAMGVRKPLKAGMPAYGFRDSVNVETGKADNRYLSLDQSMLFLSLANYLEDGIVRRNFAKDPLVSGGLELLGDRLRTDGGLLKKWARRDGSEPEQVLSEEAVDSWEPVKFSGMGGAVIETQTFSDKTSVSAVCDERGLVIDYDLGPGGAGDAEVRVRVPEIDTRKLGDITLNCDGESDDHFGALRIYLRDDRGQSQFSYIRYLKNKMKDYVIPEDKRLGIFARPQSVNTIVFKLWNRPWYYAPIRTEARKGQIIVKEISFTAK